MATYKATTLLVFLLLLPHICGSRALGQARSSPTMKAIFDTWKRRQDNTKTFDFEWEEHRTYAKASLPVFHAVPGPSADMKQASRWSLQVDRDRMRLWSNRPMWNPQSGTFVPRDHLNIFDGKDEKAFYDAADPTIHATVTNRAGYIGVHPYVQEVTDYHIWPILLMYRPLHSHIGRFSTVDWEMTTETGVAGGRDCYILRRNNGRIREQCWVDIARECTIIRYEYIADYRFQVDMVYEKAPFLSWIPAHWKTVEYLPKGSLQESSTSRVTGHTINKPLPDNWFEFEFPLGTEVTDSKAKISYIVTNRGGKRVITDDERNRGATYEQLVATESGEAGLPSNARTPWWVFLAGGAAVIVLSLAITRMRRRTG